MRRTPLVLLVGAISITGLGACSGAPPSPGNPIPATAAPTASAVPPSGPAPSGPTAVPTGAATPTTPPLPHVKIQMTTDLAKKIAVQAVDGGQVIEVKSDDVDDTPAWRVVVQTSDGRRRAVFIDKESGAILANELDNS